MPRFIADAVAVPASNVAPISLGLWQPISAAWIRLRTPAPSPGAAFDPRHHAFRFGKQLRPAARIGGGDDFWPVARALDLLPHRDELIISTKAGYDMWDGPYGNWGSRKYLLASLDQSLRRLGLAYVDIFYHHRPDPETPLEETAGALAQAVRSGKALYAAISNYPPDQTARMATLLRDLGTPCLIHQPKYSMFERTPERGLLDTLLKEGIGSIVFSPLAQGLLTNRYLSGVPADSRAGHDPRFLKPEHITPERLACIKALDALAKRRGQSLAQMALAWVLRQPAVTTALIGASKPQQVDDCVGTAKNLAFSQSELDEIEKDIGGRRVGENGRLRSSAALLVMLNGGQGTDTPYLF